jgi:hypothetical protein
MFKPKEKLNLEFLQKNLKKEMMMKVLMLIQNLFLKLLKLVVKEMRIQKNSLSHLMLNMDLALNINTIVKNKDGS